MSDGARNVPAKAATQQAVGMGKPGEKAKQGAASRDSGSEVQSLSTTPTQSQLTASMRGAKEASQTTIGAGQGVGSSLSVRGQTPSQVSQGVRARQLVRQGSTSLTLPIPC